MAPPGQLDAGLASQRCGACGAAHWRNAKPAAGAVIVRDGRVLLARRARPPRAGTWDIVGGFLQPTESPRDGAAREALEETGLSVRLGRLIDIYVDSYGPDEPVGRLPELTFNIYYLADWVTGEPRPADDVAELHWFAPQDFPADLAFDHEHALLRRVAELLDSPDVAP